MVSKPKLSALEQSVLHDSQWWAVIPIADTVVLSVDKPLFQAQLKLSPFPGHSNRGATGKHSYILYTQEL